MCVSVYVSGPLDKRPKGLIEHPIDSAVGHNRYKHIHSFLSLRALVVFQE